MLPSPSAPTTTLDAPELRALLRERFGLDDFRAGQAEALRALDEHRAVLAILPTGGGKSLIYQLGALRYPGLTLVVSPLIALMKDQIDALAARGIPAARLDSTLAAGEAREIERAAERGELRLLYVAPERFNNERFLSWLARQRIALFAVDEAHCISEWGHNFRPDYLKLAETARTLGAERVAALTATATPKVAADIARGFGVPEAAVVRTSFHRPNLTVLASPTPLARRAEVLIQRLRERPAGGTIVYVTLQRTAEEVAERLAEAGLPARAYHAGMGDEVRAEVQEWWKRSGDGIVVATIAFGMGIDKADVRYVYHYNLPKGLENYAQEIGRAGRDGLPSVCEVLGSVEDVASLENFAYGDTPTGEALRSLASDLLRRGVEFDVSLYELSQAHDIRPLVLRTALTYLELAGVLRQGTPFYATYKVKLLASLEEIGAAMPPAKAAFVEAVFDAAKAGREYHTIATVEVAEKLGEPRERIVAMLQYLEQNAQATLQVSDVRQRYYRLIEEPDADGIAAGLLERFEVSEQREVERVRLMTRLLMLGRCQTNALLKYFGEEKVEPCGHCGFCQTGAAAELPPAPLLPPIEAVIDAEELRALAASHPAALGQARQRARFLCGLTSPALTKAKLTRHRRFGALEERRFAEVLGWCGAKRELES
jgi:ATP-dependent DNA helicase RecQ